MPSYFILVIDFNNIRLHIEPFPATIMLSIIVIQIISVYSDAICVIFMAKMNKLGLNVSLMVLHLALPGVQV